MFSNPLDAGRLISFAIKQRAGVAENVRLFWLHAFSCRMVRCHDAGDTAVLRQRCIMPDLAARRAKSKSAAVYAASVPNKKQDCVDMHKSPYLSAINRFA
jgi:hypothetical protein